MANTAAGNAGQRDAQQNKPPRHEVQQMTTAERDNYWKGYNANKKSK